MKNTAGVYMITLGNERYVGSSVRIERRIIQHKRSMENGTAPVKLQKAFNDNGEMHVDILEVLPDNKTVWELRECERKWIERLGPELNTFVPAGEGNSPERIVNYAVNYLRGQYEYIGARSRIRYKVKLLKSTARMLDHCANTAEKLLTTIEEAKKGGKQNEQEEA